MTPSRLAAALRSIATKIDNSDFPSRSLVSQELSNILAAVENISAVEVAAYRQEYWILPDGKAIKVPETHGKTAVEIIEKRGDEVPEKSPGIPDFSAAMGILFKEGAARIHQYGNDIIVSVNKFTSKIIDAVTDFFIGKNLDMDKHMVLQYGGMGNFTNIEVTFLDLLESGNDPKKLEKAFKTKKYGSSHKSGLIV